MANAWSTKDPNERLDYGFDWAGFLASNPGAVINTASVVAEPAGLTIEPPIILDQLVKVWISGGTVDTTYRVTCRLVCSVPGDATGLRCERSETLYVADL